MSNIPNLPKELRSISPSVLEEFRKLLKRDLSVSIVTSETDCQRVTFDVKLSPPFFPFPALTDGMMRVPVRITDKVFGVPRTVGELILFLPNSGGTLRSSIEFPLPPDAQFTPDFSNEITIEVDPDKQISERNEGNNIASFFGTCIG